MDPMRVRILDAALDLARDHGWDAVHLHDIARRLDISLADIAARFGQKDDIAEAWFDRADAALLAVHESPGWTGRSVRERLQAAILAWLEALASHRDVTAQMLRYKFQPEHLHLQALGVLRVSRTVQWIREVAALPAEGWRRELEEAALTGIYLTTFATWLTDDSPGASRTRERLDRMLAMAESAALRFAPR
jgi:ubiquinone biosynthesis protein COQ9